MKHPSLPTRDIEMIDVFCANGDCGDDYDYEQAEVAVYTESGQREFLGDMPTCPECGAEMVEREATG